MVWIIKTAIWIDHKDEYIRRLYDKYPCLLIDGLHMVPFFKPRLSKYQPYFYWVVDGITFEKIKREVAPQARVLIMQPRSYSTYQSLYLYWMWWRTRKETQYKNIVCLACRRYIFVGFLFSIFIYLFHIHRNK